MHWDGRLTKCIKTQCVFAECNLTLYTVTLSYLKPRAVNLHTYCKYEGCRMARWVKGHGESYCLLNNMPGRKEATLFENLRWKCWSNVRMSFAIIYDPLQLCKYQCWATFLTANDGPGFSIIMTDQRWIIHLRALKYAITLQLLRIYLSLRSEIRHEKATLSSTQH